MPPGVGSAYLSVMIVNGEARSYLLVLDGPKDDKLFAAVAQAARPYLLSREKKDGFEHYHLGYPDGPAGYARQ